jgi:hypothetical protein
MNAEAATYRGNAAGVQADDFVKSLGRSFVPVPVAYFRATKDGLSGVNSTVPVLELFSVAAISQ